MKTFHELLIDLKACKKAVEWAGDKSIDQVVQECPRGDWLLWLAYKIGIDDRKLTLAKGHCANTVRHLMEDERSLKAVDTAIAYGEGKTDKYGLNAAPDSYAHYDASDADHAASAAAAASDTSYYDVADHAASAAYAAAYYPTSAAACAARKENQLQTAEICRKYIGQDIIQKVNELLNV